MKSVIYIDKQEKAEEKPVEFTDYIGEGGNEIPLSKPNEFEKVVYLGKCISDGDIFAAYKNGFISIYKGHLNSGKY